MLSYMNIHLSHVLRSGIDQLQTSSHQLEIDIGRSARTPLEERLWGGLWRALCLSLYSFFINEDDTIASLTLGKVIQYEEKWWLGLFLLELKRPKDKLLTYKNTITQAHQQRTILHTSCWSRHRCHRQMKAINPDHHRCFPCFGDFSILHWLMPEMFRRQITIYLTW